MAALSMPVDSPALSPAATYLLTLFMMGSKAMKNQRKVAQKVKVHRGVLLQHTLTLYRIADQRRKHCMSLSYIY